MKKDIEKALKEFLMDVRITGEERKKGIPIITFVYKEEDRAVLLKALPLPLADSQTEKMALTGKELLYRVDFFKEGEAKVSFGVLPVIKESAPFLTLLENAIESGERKAGYPWLCDYLKFHSALCGLEALARGELSHAGKNPVRAGKISEAQDRYTLANTAYYREVLSYVQTGRDILNACPAGTPFPPFPDRSAFMARWYRENGQGKRYTENTAGFSPKEKQDALRQRGYAGVRIQGQIYSNPDGGGSEVHHDGIKMYQPDYGNDDRNGNGDVGRVSAVPENIHVKQPRPSGYQETVFQDVYTPTDRQSGQRQIQHQIQHQVQPHSTSASHENVAADSTSRQPLCRIKTKETVIHRKQETPSIKRHTGNSLFRGKNISSKEMQGRPFRSRKIRQGRGTAESGNAKTAGSSTVSPVNDTAGTIPDSSPAQLFDDKRERQISSYKKGKYLKFQKQESQHQETYRKPDTDGTTGTSKTEEKYQQEISSFQIQQTAGEQAPSLPEMQNNLHIHQEKETAHLRRRDSGDSIRQRGKEIPGRRQQDKAEIKNTDRDSRKSRSTKENKKHGNHGKNTKKDTAHKSGAEGRRKRTAF